MAAFAKIMASRYLLTLFLTAVARVRKAEKRG
jgi:hypothetical protein